MKKSSMKTLVAFFAMQNGLPSDVVDAVDEIRAELAKDEEEKAGKVAIYEAIREVVFKHLGSAPMTLADLFAACESELPAGTKKGQVQYGLTHYWTDEIVKIENPKSANEYRRA